ncbi:hypothetical protein RFI_10077 [Reticulomyxa filosa]|uniref:Adenylate kinase n=1 Tax=Reticulomyxa filosa TaxID=46433 RepID=X6NM19_RETFI|nr:hypothetical protein RFI_10077 [Reticulomyxa filosa]|eukprot:ETO27056.1 hypothetical protein RFI_10077 [Reticulomyxa filosa]
MLKHKSCVLSTGFFQRTLAIRRNNTSSRLVSKGLCNNKGLWETNGNERKQKFAMTEELQEQTNLFNKNEIRNILLLGPPGSGKSIYGNLLSKHFSAPIISSGNIIRAFHQTVSVSSEKSQTHHISNCLASGRMVDDDIVVNLVSQEYSSIVEVSNCKMVLWDGFPRTVKQAALISFDCILKINLPEDILIAKILGRRVCNKCARNYNLCTINDEKREIVMPSMAPTNGDLSRCDDCEDGTLTQRLDDNYETIVKRLKVFRDETEPIEEHYMKQLDWFQLIDFHIKTGVNDIPKMIDSINQVIYSLPRKNS